MKKFTNVFLGSIIALTALLIPFNAQQVEAQDSDNVICTIFPFLEDIFYVGSICKGTADGAEEALSDTAAFIRFGLSLVFVGIIIVAIYVIIKAAVKYIRSEGDEDKVQEAQKAIKQVFAGVAALFVGLIGIVIILAFFNATGATSTEGLDDEVNNPLINDLDIL